jgi:hypothetical protein
VWRDVKRLRGSSAVADHVCVDCLALSPGSRPPRPRPTNGKPRAPRCATHEKGEKKRVKAANQARYREKTYGLTAEDHAALLEYQGGRCAICQVARGVVKALAVDHDHACCPGPISCGKCVRGLCCGQCNQIILGRYPPEALLRAAAYLAGDNPATRLRKTGRWPVK